MKKRICTSQVWWQCFVVIVCVLGSLNTAYALERPDEQEKQKFKQLNRTELKKRYDFVNKLGNHKVDSFLLKRALNKAERIRLEMKGVKMDEINRTAPLMAPPSGRQGMPTKGNVKILALLIEFQDETHTNSRDDIHSELFGAGDAAQAPYESLATYYDRASYNQLDLGSGNTLGWYQTSYDRTDVTQSTAGRESLIKEVLDHYEAQGHNFSQYDNDGDGVVDYFVVIWAGPNNGWGNFWWGYQTSFSDSSYKLDGVSFKKYSWQWEANPVGGAFNPRVVIHETGHALGLPDYYDYDDGVGPKGGVGGLDMMAGNKGDHNCFSKWLLDWISPVYIFSGTQNASLDASGTSQNCVLMWPPAAPNVFGEYFVVQNRQRVGNDDAPGMPADGMLIWHVDATLNAAGTNFQYNNSYSAHKILRLMEADGLEEIEGGGGADADDYYTSGDKFGPCTTPNSKKYDGTSTGIEISNFSAPGATMTAQFKHGATCAVKSWFGLYKKADLGPSDVMQARSYRDTVLANSETGSVYTSILYENSDAALDVLMENPELAVSLGKIMRENRASIDEVLGGSDAALSNPEEVIVFLDEFADKAPKPLKDLAGMVKNDLLQRQSDGEKFFGFKVSEPYRNDDSKKDGRNARPPVSQLDQVDETNG